LIVAQQFNVKNARKCYDLNANAASS